MKFKKGKKVILNSNHYYRIKNGSTLTMDYKDDDINSYFYSVEHKGESIYFADCIDIRASNTPKHYDNTKGSLYKFAEDYNLNAWEFDIVKRIVRSRKKGQFKEDLDKTIEVIKLYKDEYKEKQNRTKTYPQGNENT